MMIVAMFMLFSFLLFRTGVLEILFNALSRDFSRITIDGDGRDFSRVTRSALRFFYDFARSHKRSHVTSCEQSSFKIMKNSKFSRYVIPGETPAIAIDGDLGEIPGKRIKKNFQDSGPEQ